MNQKQTVRQILKNVVKKALSVPKYIYFIGIGVVLLGLYIASFVFPKTVLFSYAGETCLRELTLLPDQHPKQDSNGFQIEYKTKIGSALATETCLTPTTAPREGTAVLSSGPFGWFVFQNNYRVEVAAAPKVVGSVITSPIAVTKPVNFTMDKSDTIFKYSLLNGDKQQACQPVGETLNCRVDQLGLVQGSEQTVTLTRSFSSEEPVKITDKTIAILPAVTVKDSSVKEGQIVYDKPMSFRIATDKSLVSAVAELTVGDQETASAVETALTLDKEQVILTLKNELPREKTLKLTLKNAVATDGSTTAQPVVTTFHTSGGPKVVGVSIGTSGVDPNAKIVVSFDQPIADSVSISQFARIVGGAAAITKQGTQVIFSLQNVPRCTAFSLSILKGITSGSNGLVSKSDWTYNSRVNCRATSIIGYSVKGRPIVAYYYGSGPTSILFTGGIHGSEPSGTSTMQAWAAYLDTHAPEIPAGKQVVIVPNTNPDGIAAGSRYNARNVNLGRNFATADWKSDIQTSNGTIAGGGGSAPMSEPETKALAALTAQINPRVEISFHAQGRLVGANDYADSRAVGSIYASTVGYSTMFGSNAEEVMGYGFSGQYEDWIGEKLGKPAILIELPTASGNYLSSQLPALWKMVRL